MRSRAAADLRPRLRSRAPSLSRARARSRSRPRSRSCCTRRRWRSGWSCMSSASSATRCATAAGQGSGPDRAVRCDGGRGDRVAPPPGPLTHRLSPGLIVTIRIRCVALIRITLARSDLLANTARGALRSRHPAWSGGLPDRRLGRPGPTTLLRRMSAGVPTPRRRRRRRPPASTTPQRAKFHRWLVDRFPRSRAKAAVLVIVQVGKRIGTDTPNGRHPELLG